MNYCVQIKASKESDTQLMSDFMMLDVITHFETPETMQGVAVFSEEREQDIHSYFNVKPEVVGTETVEEEGQTYEIQIDNRQDLIDIVDIPTADWMEAKIHNCCHDEPINRPCSPWSVCKTHGEVPVEEEGV